MKVIDLLNKIAKGEDVPKKIKWRGVIFIYVEEENYEDYKNDMNCSLFRHDDDIYKVTNMLDDEVEIIEEEKENYEKVKIINDGKLYSTYDTWIDKYFPQYKKYWKYDNKDYDIKKEYNLIGTAPHAYGNTVALIQDPDTKQVFIFGINGLKIGIEKIEIDENGYLHSELGSWKSRKMDIAFANKINELIDIVNELNNKE